MTQCPAYTTITANTQFITGDNVRELFPDNFSRASGTVVNVTCQAGFVLNGDQIFTCQSNGQWSFSRTPTCDDPPGPTTAAPSSDEDTNILIGVVSGVAALIVLVLIVLICAVWLRDKRRREQEDDIHKNFVMGAIPDGRRYRGRDDLSTIDGELYGREPVPYRSYRRGYDDSSQVSGPMYLPPSDRDYHDRRYRSRPPSLEEEYDRRGSRPYVREWVRRTSSSQFDLPSVHGRGGYRDYRDSKLWRDVGIVPDSVPVKDTVLVPYQQRVIDEVPEPLYMDGDYQSYY